MPAFAPLENPLTDGQVELRLSAERDIPEILIAHQDDPGLYRRLGEQQPPSGAELGRLSEDSERELIAGRRATLTILQQGSDTCRGQIHVEHLDWENGRAQLRIWLAPQARGRGLASRALRLGAGWLLEDSRLARVQLQTEPDNEPMLRAARGAGFVQEGTLRSYLRRGRERIDVTMLSFVREGR